MLKRINEISKTLILLSALLYFFGFITITAFLARFGMVSYDIINARFIIGGIFSLIFIGIALLFSWHIINYLKPENFFREHGYNERVEIHLISISVLYSVSVFLTNLINLGKYSNNAQINQIFHPFKFDLVGKVIDLIQLNKYPVFVYYTKSLLDLFIYIVITICIIHIAPIIWKKVHHNNTHISHQVKKKAQEKTWGVIFFQRIIEGFFVSLYLILYIYSFNQLRSSIFSFDNLNEPKLDTYLVFSWLYYFVVTFSTFFYFFNIKKENLKLNLFNVIFEKPQAWSGVINYAIIPVLSSLLFFGQVIFPRIPYSLGGGEPRSVKLILKDIKLTDQSTQTSYILGEANNFIFVATNVNGVNKAFQINTNNIISIETK